MIKKRHFIFAIVLFCATSVFSHVDIEDGVLGAILGCAAGDAMGRQTEFLNLKQMFTRYPNGIKSFDDFHNNDFWTDKNGNRIAPYTDDTAMAKLVLEVLANSKTVEKIMPCLAQAFVEDMNEPAGWAMKERAPGNACLRGVKELEKRISNGVESFKKPWWKFWKKNSPWWDVQENNAGGCGSVMRAFPFGLVFANDIQRAEFFAVEHSKLTHGASIALAACAAMAVGTAHSLKKNDSNVVVEKMIEAAKRYDKKTAEMIREASILAKRNRKVLASRGIVSFERAYDLSKPVFEKFQGWAAHDAIAAATYVFIMAHDNIKLALYLGVHTPGDSDSIACMAGALVGARVGIKNIPKKWVKVLEDSKELIALGKSAAELV